MNTCQITQNEQGKFDLYINGQFIRSYTRKADAKRGFSRLEKQAASGCDDVAASSRQAIADTAAQSAPASNTGGQNGAACASADKSSQTNKSTLPDHSKKTTQCTSVNGKQNAIQLRKDHATSDDIASLTIAITQTSSL